MLILNEDATWIMDVCKLNSAVASDGIVRISSFLMRRAGFVPTTGYIPHLERTAENDLEAVRRIPFQILDPLEPARCATNLNHTTECDIPLFSARRALTHMA